MLYVVSSPSKTLENKLQGGKVEQLQRDKECALQ